MGSEKTDEERALKIAKVVHALPGLNDWGLDRVLLEALRCKELHSRDLSSGALAIEQAARDAEVGSQPSRSHGIDCKCGGCLPQTLAMRDLNTQDPKPYQPAVGDWVKTAKSEHQQHGGKTGQIKEIVPPINAKNSEWAFVEFSPGEGSWWSFGLLSPVDPTLHIPDEKGDVELCLRCGAIVADQFGGGGEQRPCDEVLRSKDMREPRPALRYARDEARTVEPADADDRGPREAWGSGINFDGAIMVLAGNNNQPRVHIRGSSVELVRARASLADMALPANAEEANKLAEDAVEALKNISSLDPRMRMDRDIQPGMQSHKLDVVPEIQDEVEAHRETKKELAEARAEIERLQGFEDVKVNLTPEVLHKIRYEIGPHEVDATAWIEELSHREESEEQYARCCVAGAVRNSTGQILLIRSKKEGRAWELPGGKIGKGEGWKEAFKREIAEETGLVPFDLIFGTVLDGIPKPGAAWTSVILLIHAEADGEPTAAFDAVEARWFDLADVPINELSDLQSSDYLREMVRSAKEQARFGDPLLDRDQEPGAKPIADIWRGDPADQVIDRAEDAACWNCGHAKFDHRLLGCQIAPCSCGMYRAAEPKHPEYGALKSALEDAVARANRLCLDAAGKIECSVEDALTEAEMREVIANAPAQIGPAHPEYEAVKAALKARDRKRQEITYVDSGCDECGLVGGHAPTCSVKKMLDRKAILAEVAQLLPGRQMNAVLYRYQVREQTGEVRSRKDLLNLAALVVDWIEAIDREAAKEGAK